MNPTLKNILAIVVGLMVGSIVNMAIVIISGNIIPPPEGADITTMEGLKASMHLFTPMHFLFPFFAHALGTLVGAYVAARIAAKNPVGMALVVGVIFLLGGITNVFLLSGPMWFNVVDICLAYIPMAWLGAKMAGNKKVAVTP